MAEANHTRHCAACGNHFTGAVGRGRPRRYCHSCTPSKERIQAEGRRLWDIGICVSGGLSFCRVCRKAFWAMHGGQRICGHECRTKMQRAHSETTQRKRRKADKGTHLCANPRCGAPFSPGHGDLRIRYCSLDCRKQHKWMKNPDSCHRRRARRLGVAYEAIDPIKVFERDGWKCQICMEQLAAEDRGTTKPLAPELDHVVPLGCGGSHTWANVQCACRACNLRKGATLQQPLAA